ncbi:acyltransferase family protein [Streptomyces sp. NBC_00568]|uniref:acyltransferase family protein n=1 Tax=Streptomyces sp. NBC_00568 TaxID=2975779 RepID=UPI002258188A|nr:acyltransferase family protein [Streptomyces sp. NBC_00568]MCX4993587.1 acyltransferase [Streptomyces sp. NBC_00568]
MTEFTETPATERTALHVIHTPMHAYAERKQGPILQAGSAPSRADKHHDLRPAPSLPALRGDIQGLRGLAVTLVVLAHAEAPFLAGGYVGVDVFFVISGFLITSGLIREASSSHSISLRRFYARRAVRILPLASLVALTTMLGCWLYASKLRYAEFMHDALASALYFVNIDLAASSTDYLSEGTTPSPFQHFWSLAVEEQFYFVWPVLLLMSWKYCRSTWLKALPLGVLCLVSYALAVQTGQTSASWSYFGPHTRLWELGAGSLLAFGHGALAHLPRLLSATGTWLGLAGILASALLYDDKTPFPGHYTLLPVAGAVLVIAGGCNASPSAASRLLAMRPATRVGNLSYGWYLWHWPVMMIGPAALARTATPTLSLILAVVALALAWVTLHLVEDPIRFRSSLRDRPTAALTFGVSLSATVTAASLIAAFVPPQISSTARAPQLGRSLASASNPQEHLADLLTEAATSLPRNLSPGLTDIKRQRSALYRDSCHVSYAATRSPDCVYGDTASDKVIVLFGDSHAAQWFPALDQISRRNGWKLVSLTKASCKTADVMIVNQNRPYEACDSWRKDALNRIKKLQPLLVVASSSEAATPVHRMKSPRRQWQAGYERVYQQLAGASGHLAVMLDTPWPSSDAVECASSYPLDLPTCEQDQNDAVKDPMLREASRRAARRAKAFVVDPSPWLCRPQGRCPLVVGDTFAYRDESHLAESFAQALIPVLHQELRALGLIK